MKTGLVSITFRKKKQEEIVALVSKGGLQGIEWGGDVHVPHGDMAAAGNARKVTAGKGLEVAAYGSYYRAAHSEPVDKLPFAKVLDTALELGAPTVRVWAGPKGSAAATPSDREAVAEDLRRIGSMAAAEGLTVSLEYHGGTLTDTNESAQALVRDTNHHNIRLYWQPSNGRDFAYCMDGLRAVIKHVSNVHVFYWLFEAQKMDQRPLAEGTDQWLKYLSELKQGGGRRYAMLEFVRGETDEQFLADAATLRKWVEQTG